MTFYTIPQSNPRGIFIEDNEIGVNTIIEAETQEQAEEKAEEIGIEFGYGGRLSCDCCGPRWSRYSIVEADYPYVMTRFTTVIYYADGTKEYRGVKRGY